MSKTTTPFEEIWSKMVARVTHRAKDSAFGKEAIEACREIAKDAWNGAVWECGRMLKSEGVLQGRVLEGIARLLTN